MYNRTESVAVEHSLKHGTISVKKEELFNLKDAKVKVTQPSMKPYLLLPV